MRIIRLDKRYTRELYNLFYALDHESEFMLFEEGERNITEKQVENILSSPESEGVAIGAIVDGKLIGYLTCFRGQYKRIRHTAYNVIGIRSGFRRKGIGTKLFRELFIWARENEIVRLELTVICNNKAGVKLYKNMGFKIEGIKMKAFLKDGVYLDEYYMGKILN